MKHSQTESLVDITLPQLIELNRPASNLPLNHNTIRSLQSGDYLSRFKGRGMEFDEVRPYMPGDDVRNMDWRVTARTGKAHTKLFREERERAVFLSVDYRSPMHFATRGVFKSVVAARLAGLLSWAANHHGDRIGGQIFTDQMQKEFKPQRGKQAVLRFLRQLAELSALQPKNDRSETDNISSLHQALSRLVHHTRPGSLIFLFSDFRGLNKSNEFHLIRLSRHCEVNLVFIFDPLERELPERGDFRFTNGSRDIAYHGENSVAERYNNRFVQHYNHLKELAFGYGMGFLNCDTTEDPMEILK